VLTEGGLRDRATAHDFGWTGEAQGQNLLFVKRVTHKLLHVIFGFSFALSVVDAAELTNKQVTVVASPIFEQRGEWTCLIVSNASHFYRFWSLPARERWFEVSWDTNSIYTFVVADGPYMRELLKIEHQGKTLFDKEVCNVHHIKLEREEVPIIYGLIIPPTNSPPAEIERKSFPFRHRESAWGGCIPYTIKTTKISVCAQCSAAYRKWERENRTAK